MASVDDYKYCFAPRDGWLKKSELRYHPLIKFQRQHGHITPWGVLYVFTTRRRLVGIFSIEDETGTSLWRKVSAELGIEKG